jgi:hypothetical protein
MRKTALPPGYGDYKPGRKLALIVSLALVLAMIPAVPIRKAVAAETDPTKFNVIVTCEDGLVVTSGSG